MFFEWIHPNRTDKFPSDGFAWIDNEHAFERDISEHFVCMAKSEKMNDANHS